MKWFVIVMIAVLPVIAAAEDDVTPVPAPEDAAAPAAEVPVDSGAVEEGKEPDAARPAESPEKTPEKTPDKREEAGEKSGMRFQSIDDLNRMGR